MEGKLLFSNVIYALGVVCLIAAVACFMFVLYVSPYLFLGVLYDVPSFIQYADRVASHSEPLLATFYRLMVIVPFILGGCAFAILSKIIERKLLKEERDDMDVSSVEAQVALGFEAEHRLEPESETEERDFGKRVLIYIGLILLFIAVLEVVIVEWVRYGGM